MIDDSVKRVDGLERYYKPIERFEKWTSVLFWLSAILSIVALYSQLIPWKSFQDVPTLVFSASVVLHLVLSLYVRFHLIPEAERKRRKQLLSDSFGVPLTPEQTQAYYNNPLAPSIRRLGANVLENSFFAKAICGSMAIRERIKILFYITFWLLAALWRSTPLGLLVVITQIVFSGEIISKLVCLEILRHRNEELFEELYHEFLHKVDFRSPTGTACILDAFATYEAAKAAAALKQSSSVFNRLNPRLSREWDNICERLNMNDGCPKLKE